MIVIAVPVTRAVSIPLSEKRRQKAAACRNAADRARCLAAGVALDACLQTVGLRECTVTVAEDGHGKPYLPDYPKWHFSLSHSGDFAVCALDDAPVGVDIERVRTLDPARFAERVWGVTADMTPDAFFAAWTRQESYLKVTGVGLSGLGRKPEERWQFYSLPLTGYALTVCSEKAGLTPSFSVFSDDGSVPPR